MNHTEDDETLNDKVKHVLTEARVVLPGAQALLGFQFVTMLLDDFDKLPESSKQVHLASLLATALTTVLLMTPAAYHRMVERGANTEEFHRLAGRFVILSMVPLALGITGDFFVVMRKVSDSVPLAATSATALLAVSYGFWFGYTLYRRAKLSSNE
jgi:heme A synthase